MSDEDGLHQGLDAGDMEVNRLGDALERQERLVDLETWALRRWLVAAPASIPFTWRPGDRPEQTAPGEQRDPFNGVALLNPSPYPIGLAFEAGAAAQNPLYVVPAMSYMVVPFRFVNLSVALQAPGLLVGALDASQPAVTVVACRLRVPPFGIQVGPLGSLGAPGPLKGYAVQPGTAIASVPGTASGDLYVAGYTRLRTIARLVTATATDLQTTFFPYDVDGQLMAASTFPVLESSASAVFAGTAWKFTGYDVTGYDRVRVGIVNVGAGATTCQMGYVLR